MSSEVKSKPKTNNNIFSFLPFLKFEKQRIEDEKKIDDLLTSLESNIFPADNPPVRARKRAIRRKFSKLMKLVAEKMDWDS